MKNIWKAMKANWITTWLVVAALACGSLVALGAYTEVSTVKRVVTTQAKPQTPFSSNVMRKGGSRKQMSSTAYTVTVCNYDQNYPTIYNQSEISYTLTATLKYKIDDAVYSFSEIKEHYASGSVELENYSRKFAENAASYGIHMINDDLGGELDMPVTPFSDDDYTITLNTGNQKLKEGVSSTDKYEVVIPELPDDSENFTPEFFVEVTATPSTPSGLIPLSVLLYRSSSETTEADWNGHLAESDSATVDYDFYNYILTGNGVGTVTIMWDPARFEMNALFTNTALSKNEFEGEAAPSAVTETDIGKGENRNAQAGWSKLTLKVNPFDTVDENDIVTKKGKNRYEIQLYKMMDDTSYTGNNAASKFIDYYYTPSAGAE